MEKKMTGADMETRFNPQAIEADLYKAWEESGAFVAHRFHDFHFGGNGGMVSSGQPQRRVALHPVIADRRVLQNAVHGMAHMELSGNIGRRHDNREGFLSLFAVSDKSVRLFPCFVKICFDRLRVKAGFHVGAGHFLFHLLYLLLYANSSDPDGRSCNLLKVPVKKQSTIRRSSLRPY